METRTTSNRITELRLGEIFVFGSNLQGCNGSGEYPFAGKVLESNSVMSFFGQALNNASERSEKSRVH